ncbi:UNVERIFIED_CONTAM: putative carotenoid cleavage dioxygenase 4, chloroplastic [Sesamum radiatum]|uniref:Carotenoid cleavage dioxygenase 4, chloroplastic n=1 Tax=Sesamum radiatum TaxID=300843 RepID=A0AAW2M509_SESRA
MMIVGVVKLDLSLSSDDCCDCVVASRMYEAGCTGNEPFFVPNDAAADEDDGFLVTYVHDEISKESKFLIMDAKSPTLEIVAAVKLPGSAHWLPWTLCESKSPRQTLQGRLIFIIL